MADTQFTSIRQAQREILDLLVTTEPTLQRLHTRMCTDPVGWIDSLDEFERRTVGMALSLASFAVLDTHIRPPSNQASHN